MTPSKPLVAKPGNNAQAILRDQSQGESMALQAPTKTGFEKWQDSLNKAVGDPTWDAYDCEIRMAVAEFNSHLMGTGGYRQLDWTLVKAMLWTETGATSTEWLSKPMQIGVSGDPGLRALLSGAEGGELILPPSWQWRLKVGTVRTIAAHNIRAGIGYLLMRLANFEYKSILSADVKTIHQVTIKPGDSLERIAKSQGSTTEILRALNPTAAVLRPGQVLKYQNGAVQRVITSWRPITTAIIAQRYNGGGDPNYAKKLDYALSLIRKGKETVCK